MSITRADCRLKEVSGGSSIRCACYLHRIVSKTHALSASVEMLLHLLWRHVCYYSSGQTSLSASFGHQRPSGFTEGSLTASQSHLRPSTLRLLSMPDPTAFRAEAALVLSKIVDKIGSIELVRFASDSYHTPS